MYTVDIGEGLAQLTDLYLETRLAPVARTIRLSAVHSNIQVHMEILKGSRERDKGEKGEKETSRGNDRGKSEEVKRRRHEKVENGRRKRGEGRAEKGEGEGRGEKDKENVKIAE